MRRRIAGWWLGTLFLLALFPPASGRAEGKPEALLGQEILFFSLPSQDRLVSYPKEFHGKRNLVITFFPAAFTPT
jgi:hypothetical protein